MAIPVTMIPSLVQAGAGLGQAFWGLTSKNKRPKYTTPAGQRSALNLAKMRAFDPTSAGESQALDRVNLAAANAANAAALSGNPQESIAAILGQQERGLESIYAGSQQQQNRELDQLGRSFERQAEYEDAEFGMNEFGPYAQKEQLKERMLGGGLENIFGAVNTLAMLQAMGLGSTASGNKSAKKTGIANIDPSIWASIMTP